jgi:hypothetical protein
VGNFYLVFFLNSVVLELLGSSIKGVPLALFKVYLNQS